MFFINRDYYSSSDWHDWKSWNDTIFIDGNCFFNEDEVLDENIDSVNNSDETLTNEIEIISDDGSTLNISDVSDTINIAKDDNKPKNIVVPQEKK